MMFAWMHLHSSIISEESTFSYHSVVYCNRAEKRQATEQEEKGGREERWGRARKGLVLQAQSGKVPLPHSPPTHCVARLC